MHNPLKRPILDILKNAPSGLKEYELHRILGGDAFEQFIKDCDDQVALFRKHFLVMNALYELHEELLQEGIVLQISALDIHLRKVTMPASEDSLPEQETGFNKLSHYYRDWNNFWKTGNKDVAELLQIFWKKFLARDEKEQALRILGVDRNASWPDIQKKYRRLCQQHHPDKGGDAILFIEIRHAYDNLKYLFESGVQ